MEEEEKPATITRRFFKIMLLGFHENLNLPQHVCKNLTDNYRPLPDRAILETQLGKWRVRVCTNREGSIWFQTGWPDFAQQHGLNVGDLVMFEPTSDVGKLYFKAIVFDTSACEKEFLNHPLEDAPKPKKQELPEDAPKPIIIKSKVESDAIDLDCKEPYFIMTMSPYHAKKYPSVRVPPRFMRINNLDDKESIIVKDPQGREWRVRMHFYVRKNCHCRWAKGWDEFYNGNNLKDGDVCTFKLLMSEYHRSSKVVFDVQIKPKTMFVEF